MVPENKLKFIRGCLKHITCSRNQNEDNEAYRKGVLEPYNEMKEMYNTMVKENSEPSNEQLEKSLKHLLTSFKTKKLPQDEQIERIESLLNDTDARDLMSDYWLNIKNAFYR